ncbi:hypothetical protein CEN47_23205, partial [Fischerella thermalis CCMEE 5319]
VAAKVAFPDSWDVLRCIPDDSHSLVFVSNAEGTGTEERLLYRPVVQTQIACADKEVNMNWTRLPSLWPLLAVAALLLAGCQLSQVMPPAAAPPASGEVEIPFETIALDEIGVNVELGLIPQLILLTSSDDAAKIKDWVKAEVYTQLESLDFEQYAIVALFRGRKPSTNYQTVIERIERQG